MSRQVLFIWALLVTYFLSSTTMAQEERVTARLDGRALFRVGPGDDQDAAARAAKIESRLRQLLENEGRIAPSRVEMVGANWVITVSGIPIVTLAQQDADDNLAKLDALSQQWAQIIDDRLAESGKRRISAWGRFTSDVQGSVEGAFARLLESALTIIPRLTAALLVILLFWGIASAVRWVMRQLFHLFIRDLTIENLIKQVGFYSVWILGLVLAIDALGFDPQAAATGLGLTGLALGFALKDIISNFVSGLLILFLRPFQLGDQIIVGETEGTVERIELRATQIRTYDGRAVLVPNAEVFTSRVTNNTASPVRRGRVQLFVGYETDIAALQSLMASGVVQSEGVMPSPPPAASVVELTASDILLEVRFWTDSRRADFQATSSNVRETVLRLAREAGVPLPDPSTRRLLTVNSAAAETVNDPPSL